MNTRYSGACALALVLCGLFAGCEAAAPRDWDAIAACLPGGLTLATEFCPDNAGCGPGQRTTVKKKLAELGARARDGKLFDSAGREIAFHSVPHRGAQPSQEQRDREARELEALRRTHTVVLMHSTLGPVP